MRIISPGKSALIKYGFEGSVRDVNAEDLKQFVADFKADKLSPFLTSEDVPTSQEGPITKVVAKNFNEIVMDTTKDVVIYFHSNNCRKCEHVDPIWDDLSAEYSQVHDLVIAKMDFNANDVENLNVKGLPAIRYYPKDDKEGTSLDDKRHLK